MPGQTYNITLDLLGVEKVNGGLSRMQGTVQGVTSAYTKAAQTLGRVTAATTAVVAGVQTLTEAWKTHTAQVNESATFEQAQVGMAAFKRVLRATVDDLGRAGSIASPAADLVRAKIDEAGDDINKLRVLSQQLIAIQGGKGGPSAALAQAQFALEKAQEEARFKRLERGHMVTEESIRQHFSRIEDLQIQSHSARQLEASQGTNAEEKLALLNVARQQQRIELEGELDSALKKYHDAEAKRRQSADDAEVAGLLDRRARQEEALEREYEDFAAAIALNNEAEQQAADEQIAINRRKEEAKRNLHAEALMSMSNSLAQFAEFAKASGKKGFAAYKALAIASAVIGTAAGAIQAYQSAAAIPYVGFILGPIAAAAAVAAGVAQIAQIAAQSYATGGMTPGNSTLATVGEAGPEFVVTNRGLQNIGPAGMNLLSGINAGLVNAADFALGMPAAIAAGVPDMASTAGTGSRGGAGSLTLVLVDSRADAMKVLETAEGETRVIEIIRGARVEVGIPT